MEASHRRPAAGPAGRGQSVGWELLWARQLAGPLDTGTKAPWVDRSTRTRCGHALELAVPAGKPWLFTQPRLLLSGTGERGQEGSWWWLVAPWCDFTDPPSPALPLMPKRTNYLFIHTDLVVQVSSDVTLPDTCSGPAAPVAWENSHQCDGPCYFSNQSKKNS